MSLPQARTYEAGDRVRVVADDGTQYQGHEGTAESRGRYGALWVRFDSGEREQFADYRLEPVAESGWRTLAEPTYGVGATGPSLISGPNSHWFVAASALRFKEGRP